MRHSKKLRAALAALSCVCLCLTACESNDTYSGSEKLQLFPDDLFDTNEVIITDDYDVYECSEAVRLYTTHGVNLYFPGEYTFEMCLEAAAGNSDIPDTYKACFENFIIGLQEKYPDADLTCLYKNLSGLQVLECDNGGMIANGSDPTVFALFRPSEKKLLVNITELESDSFEYVLYHEISHMLNNLQETKKGYQITRDFSMYGNSWGYFLEESFNTLLAEDVTGLTIPDCSYRIGKNYTRILMDAADFTLEDYLNGCLITFQNAVNDRLPEDLRTDDLAGLMQAEWQDIRSSEEHADEHIEAEDLTQLQGITATLYFEDRITADMSAEEIAAEYENLISRITADVHTTCDDYTFDFSEVIRVLYCVCEEKGITQLPEQASLTASVTVSPYTAE